MRDRLAMADAEHFGAAEIAELPRRGTVKLTGTARGHPSTADLAQISAGAGHLIPNTEGTRSRHAMGDGAQQVTSDTKEIEHESVHRQEALRVRGGFEPSHLPLALPRRLMRDLRSIVLVLPGAVHN